MKCNNCNKSLYNGNSGIWQYLLQCCNKYPCYMRLMELGQKEDRYFCSASCVHNAHVFSGYGAV